MTKRTTYSARRQLLLEALRSRELTATAKIVLTVLVERFSDAVTGESFPGLTRLGHEIGHSRKTAQRGISDLEALGFIDICAPSKGRVTNLYTLVLCPEKRALKKEMRFDGDCARAGQKSRRKRPRRTPRARKLTPEDIGVLERAFEKWVREVADALGGDEKAHLLLMDLTENKLREMYQKANACGQSHSHVADDIRRGFR